jgi:hypothetical protein
MIARGVRSVLAVGGKWNSDIAPLLAEFKFAETTIARKSRMEIPGT